ncbi:MAG: metallophosphoesterase family protein [Pseudomonadota bacterium]
MRLAVISDIHGNLDAFESVLSDISSASVDKIISLGDNIGYGAEPEAVLRRLQATSIPSIIGNHELAVIDSGVRKWFNPLARKSIMHTVAHLSDDAIGYLHTLPTSLHSDGCWFVHGFPTDSPTIYLFQASDDDIRKGLTSTGCTICFVGHTHMLEMVTVGTNTVRRQELPCGGVLLDGEKHYIINIGSVGQPRDGNRDAKYVIFDTDSRMLDVRYIPYDREAAARKVIAAGLPKAHAARLL